MQALESTLRLSLFDRSGKIPQLTDAGLAVPQEARRVVEGAENLRARAESIRGGLEPELTLAADEFLPTGPGMQSLRALSGNFPNLPVTLLTESRRDAERHLRDGTASFAIYPYDDSEARDLEAELLVEIEMVPLAAPGHILASHRGVLSRADLAPHIQLVLERDHVGDRPRGMGGERLWHFANINVQRGFILGGFGWGYLPIRFAEEHLAAGKLQRLRLLRGDRFTIPLHVVHLRKRRPGPAAQWLITRLREILAEEATRSEVLEARRPPPKKRNRSGAS